MHAFFYGEVCALPDPRFDVVISSQKGEKMSVLRSACLAHEISAAWLRNAFAGLLGAWVLLLLLVLVPRR